MSVKFCPFLSKQSDLVACNEDCELFCEPTHTNSSCSIKITADYIVEIDSKIPELIK